MTRAVFFDAGHTLVYAHPDLGSVYAGVTARLGVTVDAARFAETFGPVFKEAMKAVAATTTASDAQDLALWRGITRGIYDRIDALRPLAFEAWFDSLYRRFGEAEVWRCYDDVAPVLERLRARGMKLGIVSNWDSRLRSIAEATGLAKLVDFLVISAEAGVRKPDPGIFRLALDRAGVHPEEALHVGDLPEEDGEGARRAGVRPVIIDRRRGLPSASAPIGAPVISSLEELFPLL